MMPMNRVCVYLCSDLGDLRNERAHLHERVFSCLREACARRSVEVEIVDLNLTAKHDDPLAQVRDLVPRFRAIDRCRPFFVALLGDSGGPALNLRHLDSVVALMHAGIEPADEWVYEAAGPSLVELEIRHGVLNEPDAAQGALLYARAPSAASADGTARPGAVDPKLTELKRAIQERGLALIDYASIEALGERLLDDLRRTLAPGAEWADLSAAVGPAPVPVDRPAEPAAEAPRPEPTIEPEVPISLRENAQFSVYRPRMVVPDRWYPMLAFAYLAEGRPGESRALEPIEEVARQAAVMLADAQRPSRRVVDARQAGPSAEELTLVPEVEGVEFNPPRQTFLWTEGIHRAEFSLRAAPALDGRDAKGRVSVFLGGILLADVAIAFSVDSVSGVQVDPAEADASHARSYRRIYGSYSRADLPIAEQFERYVRALGGRYPHNWCELRAGEAWNNPLAESIRQADVFQLFWSSNAMRSPFVRQEWEYALSLNRRNFVRPTYWEDPLPESSDGSLPPPSLRRLRFQRLGSPDTSAGASAPARAEVEPSGGEFSTDETPARPRGSGFGMLLFVAAIVLALLIGALWLWRG